MSVKAAPAAALRRLRDVLRIICKPRFLAATANESYRYPAFAENQRREDANGGCEQRCLSLITRPSHLSMDEHDFF